MLRTFVSHIYDLGLESVGNLKNNREFVLVTSY